MTQKVVKLISFELKNYRIIRAVNIDFQKWKDVGVIEVIGDMGNGKSSLLEGLAMAITGTSQIKDKSLLDLGFKSEALLVDGDHKVYLAIKVTEISRGINKGSQKFESILYEKDEDGKIITNPIIDGKKATASEYTKMLNTTLTFRMSSLFSENQTVHSKLIEDLFSKELQALGVDEIVDEIKKLKADRDFKRHERDRVAASMEAFKEMNLDEEKLKRMGFKPTDEFEKQIIDLEVEKGLLSSNIEKKREEQLIAIERKARAVTDKIRDKNQNIFEKYEQNSNEYKKLKEKYEIDITPYHKVENIIDDTKIPPDWCKKFEDVLCGWEKEIEENNGEYFNFKEMGKPTPVTVSNGVVNNPDNNPAFKDLINEYNKLTSEYKELQNSGLEMPDKTVIDEKIANIRSKIKVLEHNNDIVSRYNKWKNWIESCGLYEKKIDELRKLYSKISTDVDGLSIVPSVTESGKLELWMEYDGSHDPELFYNKTHVSRRLYEYSKSQRAIVGVLLQAARLDKKEKALRLAVLDDYTQTKKGKELLEKICQEKNLKLVIAKTDDKYDIKKLNLGEIIMENGEILLG